MHKTTLTIALSAIALLLTACSADKVQGIQVRESDVRVKVNRAPEDAAIRTTVHITPAKPGEQYVRVSVTNDSKSDITLRQLTVELPWTRPTGADDLLCTGGWDMGRSEARVWPSDTRQKLETGSYVLTRTAAGSTFAGFVTWKTFHSKLRWEKDTLVIDADGEGRLLKPGETVQLEKVWLVQTPGKNWQDLLFTYADRIAEENKIRLNRPKPYVGWATWDYYGRTWDYDKAAANIEKLAEICPQADFVQIDGGWWPARGDYMLVKPSLQPDGMKRLADLIRSKNYTAGIHLDGMRGDAKSTVAREHPDYFLKDGSGKMLVQHQMNTGEPLDNTFFDYSNPGACDYIKRVMQNIRKDWKYDYFKIDFLRFGINEFIHVAVGKDTVITPQNRSLTSVERFHRGLAAMREGMGPDAYFLSCSAVFGPSFGHVDALRSGADIHPQLSQYKKCALDNSGNFYLHGKVVYTDADYHVVRATEDQDDTRVKARNKDGGNLSINEAWLWTHYVALCGGPRLNSDNLLTLRPERRALFLFTAGFPTADRYIPLDFWAHARNVEDPPAVILSEAKGDAYLGLFNWTDAEKTIVLTGMNAAQLAKLSTVSGSASMQVAGDTLTVTLPALHSAIVKIPGGDFDALRKAINVN